MAEENSNKQKSAGEKLQEQLSFKFKNQWDVLDADLVSAAHKFSEGYKRALDQGKTEREFHDLTIARLEEAGFKNLDQVDKLERGDKVYRSVHNKGLLAAVVGSESPAEGLILVGSHIDSPRLDLKPYPLYEQNEFALFKTHYYGGIKKYQWLSTQLAIHGVVVKQDGSKVEICIGEDDDDPVFTITDLLPHLGRKQMAKPAKEVIEGEQLNVLLGSQPYPEEALKDRFKLNILSLLHEKYGITERDLITGELEIVPAHKARDVGLDRSFIGAYGQDDRVCAWTSLEALLDAMPQAKTQGILFFDKEEVGSDGNTGAKSDLYFFALNELCAKILGREPSLLETQQMLEHSKLLSSDVTAAYDPDFSDVYEPMNTAYCNYGIGINKYTGGGGKGGTTDANAEYFNEVTRLFEQYNIPWQAGELGKIDEGGGGTIAKFFANAGMNVIDCGVPVLAMHSCFEVTTKLDVFNTYRAYKAFFDHAE